MVKLRPLRMPLQREQVKQPLIWALVFAVIGIVTLIAVRAAPTDNFIDPESGSVSGLACVQSDSSASNGAAVRFGASTNTADKSCPADGGTTTPPPGSAPGVLANLFPIGVDLAPSSAFSTWKARGINTIIREQIGATDTQVKTWSDAVEAAGLYQIRKPLANPADDIGRKSLLAWAPHKDESEATGASQVSWETVQARYNSLRNVTKTIPIELALQGAFNQHDNRAGAVPYSGEAWYQKYFAGADWLTVHRYPVNGGGAWLCDVNTVLSCFNGMVYKVQTWQEPDNARPWFGYLEASDYDTSDSHPGPTGAQTKAQAWYLISQGARGIFYFPERVVPSFTFDATTADMQNMMAPLHAQIKALTPVLQGPVSPTSVKATTNNSSLQAGWRVHSSGKYFIITNMSNSAINGTITLTGVSGTATVYGESRTEPITSGAITDSFAPYAVHIYQIP